MSRSPMLDNIFAQPASHRRVIALHQGEQRAAFVESARLLRACRGRVIVSGMGASFFAALPAVCRLAQHGYLLQALESSELLHYGSASLRSPDVGVLISRSGGSIEVLRLAEKMRATGMTVIAVTNVPDAPLASIADLSLLIGADTDQLIAVQTYTGTVLTLLLLAEQVLAGETAQLSQTCQTLLPALSDYIEQNYLASETWRDFFDSSRPLYLLGRGPALATAHEGALLFHETAKSPAVSMSCGQFRHGPVEVVAEAFRAILVGTSAETRAMDQSLAIDLAKMGARVSWIGPASPVPAQLPSWPSSPELGSAPALASLFDIVPLQLAAYRLALWRDIVPGDFRYASEVTADESGFPLLQAKLSRV